MTFHSLRQSHRGSAILIALIILILLTLMTTTFLERIWTFSQSSKGIEASNMAYYNALGVVEQQLIYTGVTKYQPWNIQNLSELTGTNTGRSMIASTGSSVIPKAGEGNSQFDPNYNIITLGEPTQLVVPNGIDWSRVTFEFRVPKIGTSGTGFNTAYNGSGYILWTFGYTGASLFASGETNIFKGSDINTVTSQFLTYKGTTNSGTTNMSVNDFYTTTDYLGVNGINCTGYVCTLKLSLIRPVPLADGRILPFLEYRIDFAGVSLPNQYMILQADSYAYGFFRSRTVRVPQITTNTALDFAILQ